MPILWTRDPKAIAPPVDGKRVIPKGPLIDLEGLQRCLKSGQINPDRLDQFWPATKRCRDAIENYDWSPVQVGEMIQLLVPGKRPTGDYKKSEWCEVDGGKIYPCDVYTFGYDEERHERNRNGWEIYLKFSLDTDGALMLVLVQSHPS
jgi:hypothetical protein